MKLTAGVSHTDTHPLILSPVSAPGYETLCESSPNSPRTLCGLRGTVAVKSAMELPILQFALASPEETIAIKEKL